MSRRRRLIKHFQLKKIEILGKEVEVKMKGYNIKFNKKKQIEFELNQNKANKGMQIYYKKRDKEKSID